MGTIVNNIEKKLFYQKFIDEEKVESFCSKQIARKYNALFYSITCFAIAPGLMLTFVGYNFQHPFAISIFGISIVFLALSIIDFVRFLIFENKHQIFKKNKMKICLISPIYVLSLVMCLSAYFTTTFVPKGKGWEIDFNPFPLFFIYIPLLISYILFNYFAWIECLKEYL